MKVDDYRRQIGAILWTMYEKKCAEAPKRQSYDPTKLTNAEGYSAKAFDLRELLITYCMNYDCTGTKEVTEGFHRTLTNILDTDMRFVKERQAKDLVTNTEYYEGGLAAIRFAREALETIWKGETNV